MLPQAVNRLEPCICLAGRLVGRVAGRLAGIWWAVWWASGGQAQRQPEVAALTKGMDKKQKQHGAIRDRVVTGLSLMPCRCGWGRA